MSKKIKRIMALILSIIMCLSFTAAAGAVRYIDSYPNTHRNSGQNIADLIAVARTQLGYTELSTSTGFPISASQDGGYTKYGASFGDSTGAWCAYFVSWCTSQAGISTSVVPRIGNTRTMVNWFTNHSVFKTRSSGYSPKTGDIIFYNWSGGSNAQHVGIITGVSGNSIYTIEGNTDSSYGYRCAGKTRSRSAAYIVGYGVPAYNDSATYSGSYSFASSSSSGASSSDSIVYSTSKLSIITTTASDISSTNATLNGSVKNSGRLHISTAGFFFGTDKEATKKLAKSYNTSASSLKLSMDLKKNYGSLEPNVTYYYRAFATIDGRDYIGPTYAVVTVDDQPQQLVLSENTLNIGVGQTSEVMAVQLPVGSKDEGVSWTSPDESIAKVNNDGVITGVGYGTVSLTAKTNYGSISTKCDINVLIPTPDNISIENSSLTSLTLKWDPVNDAVGYVIYRADAGDAEFDEYKKLGSDKTTFVDKGLTPGKKYYYKIMTVADIEKYNSDQSETIYSIARLSTPTITDVYQSDTTALKIVWDKVDDAESYTVYRSNSYTGLYTIIGSVSGNEFTDFGTTDKNNYYKVIANNSEDTSSSAFSEAKGIKVLLDENNYQGLVNSAITNIPVTDTNEPKIKSKSPIARVRTVDEKQLFSN